MKNKKSIIVILSLVTLVALGGCSSFPRSTVSTEGQDMTLALYNDTVDFAPVALGTVYLNRKVFILDSTETTSGIRDQASLFDNVSRSLDSAGYTVVDTIIETLDPASTITIVTVAEAVNEFTMYYYYSYWYGYYYPPYYGGWYSYTYTVGTVVVGMMREDKHLWTGTISGFTSTATNQTQRITRGIDELFTLAPFNL